jgi:hypothetical protein
MDKQTLIKLRESAEMLKTAILNSDELPENVKKDFETWNIDGGNDNRKYYKYSSPPNHGFDLGFAASLALEKCNLIPDGFYIKHFEECEPGEADFSEDRELNGKYIKAEDHILINKDLSYDQAIQTVAHETRHYIQFLKNEDMSLKKRDAIELDADIFGNQVLMEFKQLFGLR